MMANDTIQPVNPRAAAAAKTQLMQSYQQVHDNLMRTFDKELFFVVGCQKSGTTWLEKILNGHSEMVCRGEAIFGVVLQPALQQALGTFNQHIKDRNTQVDQAGADMLFNEVQLDYLFLTAAGLIMSNWLKKPNIKAIGEKTPEHAKAIPLFERYFPAAKYVHIIRDGRDVAVSGWFHNVRYAGERFAQQFPTMPTYIKYLCEHHWIPYITAAQQFGQSHPDRYFELRYEQLHEDPKTIVEQLLNFLNVDASQQAVMQCLEAGAFKTLTKGRAEGDEDKNSFYRKGVAGDWKNHFDDAATEAFEQTGGEMLRQLGYL